MSTVLSPLILLGGTGMILVAVGFVVYAVIKRLGWAYLGFGALMWIITVAIKFALAVPSNSTIYRALNGALGNIGAGLFDLYVGMLTGITEVGIVWLVLRYTRFGKVEWKRALAFGIGFGAIEVLLLGLGSLLTMLTVLLAPQVIPSESLSQLALANNILYGIAPIVERFFTVWVHIFCNVLIFFAIAKSQTRWFWLSFWFKSLIDAVAAYAQTASVIVSLEGIWAIEAIVILWGILGWLGVRWIQSRYAAQLQTERPKRSRYEFATALVLILVFVVMTIGAVAGFLSLQGKALTGSERDAVLAYSEPKTDNLMKGINDNDYAAFSRDLNDRMKGAINADGLANMRIKVNGKIGNYVSRQVDTITQSGDVVTVVYQARFENEYPVTMRISFEAAEPHRVSGLWFDSAKLRQQ